MTADLTDDLFLGGKLRLSQLRRGHRFGGDAALLVAAARSRLMPGTHAADLGAGVGPVGLGLAMLGAEAVTLVEIDPELSELSRRNAGRNGLDQKAICLAADVVDLGRANGPHEALAGRFSLVAANPPFDDAARFRTSPDAQKSRAHADGGDVVEVWIAAAARLLAPGGSLVMIHRPEALAELLPALAKRFGEIRLRPVQPRADASAARVLIAARLGRKSPLALLPPLVMHGSDGRFTPEADAAQRGDAAIPMD